MAVFVIERRFAEAIDLSEEDVREINLINDEEDVRWLYSFLSVDRRKTYCLYEASSVEAVRRAAVRVGLPADVVIEVCGKVHSDGSLNPRLTVCAVAGWPVRAARARMRRWRPGSGCRRRSSSGCSGRGWRRCSR